MGRGAVAYGVAQSFHFYVEGLKADGRSGEASWFSCLRTSHHEWKTRVTRVWLFLFYSSCAGFGLGFTGNTSPTAGLRGSFTMLGSSRVVGFAQ